MFPAFFLFASKGCGVGGEGRGEDFFLAGSCARGTITAIRSTVPLRPGQGGDASWPETSPRSPLLCTGLAVGMHLIPSPRWQPAGSGRGSELQQTRCFCKVAFSGHTAVAGLVVLSSAGGDASASASLIPHGGVRLS